ncbi:MAG: hypothetical protein QXJ75_03865 [Candidatus Bathyarchaeia archaeon]
MTPKSELFRIKRTILDRGCADFAELQPIAKDSKIEAVIFNLNANIEKVFRVDRAFYGSYKFVEITPKNLKESLIMNIRIYIVEKIWSLTLLEMVR